MVKRLAPAIVVVALLFQPAVAFAITPTPSPATMNVSTGQEERGTFRLNQQTTTSEGVAPMLLKQDTFQEMIQEKRAAAAEAAKTRRAAYQAKLELLKDMRKKATVEAIDLKISTFNQTHTDKLATMVDTLQSLVYKLQTKSVELKSAGKDTTALETAVEEAQNAVNVAKAAVTTQAGKEYVLSVTTETTLKTTVGKTVSEFRTDMAATHKSVMDARQAVANAVMELGKLRGDKMEHTDVTEHKEDEPTSKRMIQSYMS